MTRAKISEQDWKTFLRVARQLGLDVEALATEEVRFTMLEAVGHQVGRAVAQAMTERLALERAERLIGSQPCPCCGRRCPLVHRKRPMETIDGPIELHEPVCHCPSCRRDFFPSASGLGTRSAEL